MPYLYEIDVAGRKLSVVVRNNGKIKNLRFQKINFLPLLKPDY